MKKSRILFVLIISAVAITAGALMIYNNIGYFIREQKEEGLYQTLRTRQGTKKEKGVKEASKTNPDMTAWIEIPDTTISYPVMQTKENPDFYLNHNFNRESSFYGTPYLDARCDLDSTNLLIYGHNINGGRMFGGLMDYTSSEFYMQHKSIHFITENADAWYEIIAVIKCDSFSSWYAFINATSKEEYDKQIAFTQKSCLYQCDLKKSSSVDENQQLITLSTCDNTGGNNRFLVVGLKIKSETENEQ